MQVLCQRLTIVAFLVASDVVAFFGGIGATATRTAVTPGGKRLTRDVSFSSHIGDLNNIPVRKRSHAQAGGDGRHSRKNKIQSDAEEEDDERKLIKIDLSSLRSTFPGIAFYNQDSLPPTLLSQLHGNAESDIMWPSTPFVQYSPQLGAIVYPNSMEIPYDLVGPDDTNGRMINPIPIPYASHPEGNSILLLPSTQKAFNKFRNFALPDDQSTNINEWKSVSALDNYKSSAPYTHPLHEEGEDALYDFLADMPDKDMPMSAELVSLTDNLPLGEEIIVPLDWEENFMHRSRDFSQANPHAGQKRHVFVSQGWKPGGYSASSHKADEAGTKAGSDNRKGITKGYTSLFGSSGWRPGKKRSTLLTDLMDSDIRPTNNLAFAKLPSFASSMKGGPPENVKRDAIKKNVFFSKGWGPGGRPLAEKLRESRKISQSQPSRKERNVFDNILRKQSQQSWELPRQQWSIPHLFGPYW